MGKIFLLSNFGEIMEKWIKECKKSCYKSIVSNLKTVNANKWWREIKNLSGMADKNNHWFENLTDGETV